MSAVNPGRKQYVSPRRSEQLDATRRRILEAARQRFNERGYANTTMAAVAETAGLAVPTLYKNFGNKRQLLLELVNRTINSRVGPELATVIDRTTPAQRLEALAAMTVNLGSAAADVVSVALAAAGADPEFAQLTRRMGDSRRRNAALIVRSLEADGALAPDRTPEEARDILWALASPELYEQLVTRAGWTDTAFQAWLAETLKQSVLGGRAR